jgi:hypothetical protein
MTIYINDINGKITSFNLNQVKHVSLIDDILTLQLKNKTIKLKSLDIDNDIKYVNPTRFNGLITELKQIIEITT